MSAPPPGNYPHIEKYPPKARPPVSHSQNPVPLQPSAFQVKSERAPVQKSVKSPHVRRPWYLRPSAKSRLPGTAPAVPPLPSAYRRQYASSARRIPDRFPFPVASGRSSGTSNGHWPSGTSWQRCTADTAVHSRIHRKVGSGCCPGGLKTEYSALRPPDFFPAPVAAAH